MFNLLRCKTMISMNGIPGNLSYFLLLEFCMAECLFIFVKWPPMLNFMEFYTSIRKKCLLCIQYGRICSINLIVDADAMELWIRIQLKFI